jgi:hypothetical protein
MAGTATRLLAVCRYEWRQAWRNVLTWAAIACLVSIPLAMSLVFTGTIQQNGHPVAEKVRLTYAMVVGLTLVNFLSTLYVLCLCLERTGSSYLKHNDILILARALPRPAFWCAKFFGLVIPGLMYSLAGVLVLAADLLRRGAGFFPNLLLSEIPIALGLALIAGLYLALRNHFGNFLIFFLWLLALPVIYVGDLWHIYGGFLRDGPRFGLLTLLPQLGGLHSVALGWAHFTLWREGAFLILVNGSLWLIAALAMGTVIFTRKRL